jgi:hypothetical protein
VRPSWIAVENQSRIVLRPPNIVYLSFYAFGGKSGTPTRDDDAENPEKLE